jgi:hypothetical protein
MPCAGAKERTWILDCESPEGAKTVVPVTRSASLHSASAVMSGLSAASAAASLISPTTHTGPTSIFITALAGASGIDGICRCSRSAFAGGPLRKMRPSSSTESSISPAPHSWMICFLKDTKPDSSAACAEPIVGCPANGSSCRGVKMRRR